MMGRFMRDSQGRNAPPLRLVPSYRGEPGMVNGDERALYACDHAAGVCLLDNALVQFDYDGKPKETDDPA